VVVNRKCMVKEVVVVEGINKVEVRKDTHNREEAISRAVVVAGSSNR
jgi:hypothetical protein